MAAHSSVRPVYRTAIVLRSGFVLAIVSFAGCAASPTGSPIDASMVAKTEAIQGFVGICSEHRTGRACAATGNASPSPTPLSESELARSQLKGAETSNPANPFPQFRTEEVVRIGPPGTLLTLNEIPFVNGPAASSGISRAEAQLRDIRASSEKTPASLNSQFAIQPALPEPDALSPRLPQIPAFSW